MNENIASQSTASEQLEFVAVTQPEQIANLAILAEEIWNECYADILQPGESEWVLNHLISTETLTRNIADEDYEYFFMELAGKPVGYFAYVARPEFLYLSKIYIHESARGTGLARKAMDRIRAAARAYELPAIRLNVNRGNLNSIAAYEHLGFVKLYSEDIDVGGGWQMNDWCMELRPI